LPRVKCQNGRVFSGNANAVWDGKYLLIDINTNAVLQFIAKSIPFWEKNHSKER
jgi:hypothetical protein